MTINSVKNSFLGVKNKIEHQKQTVPVEMSRVFNKKLLNKVTIDDEKLEREINNSRSLLDILKILKREDVENFMIKDYEKTKEDIEKWISNIAKIMKLIFHYSQMVKKGKKIDDRPVKNTIKILLNSISKTLSLRVKCGEIALINLKNCQTN